MALEEVALRKESVDRNARKKNRPSVGSVALRKESVDRNPLAMLIGCVYTVALRKESVDRNVIFQCGVVAGRLSLSARRAWIEIFWGSDSSSSSAGRSPQGERG